jgi:hypothetical protein
MSDMLRLSTQVAPPKKFTVDDEEFELLSLENIGRDDEVKLSVLFHRFTKLLEKFDRATNDESRERLATKVRDTRIEIIVAFTTLGTELADQLPLPAQNALLKAVGKSAGVAEGLNLGGDDDDDD